MRKIVVLLSIFCVSGCFAAPLVSSPAAEGVSSLANTAESTTTGFETIRSTVDLNAANLRLLELQAAAVETQARALEKKRQQEMSERAATVGILRDAANARHDPTLDDLAIWVDAGGDPNIAIKYMLDHQTPPAIR
jgi:hypothetical protein